MTKRETYLIAQLQSTIDIMMREYSEKTFFTIHMVIKNAKVVDGSINEPNWALRRLIRQPFFYLDNIKGWQVRSRVL